MSRIAIRASLRSWGLRAGSTCEQAIGRTCESQPSSGSTCGRLHCCSTLIAHSPRAAGRRDRARPTWRALRRRACESNSKCDVLDRKFPTEIFRRFACIGANLGSPSSLVKQIPLQGRVARNRRPNPSEMRATAHTGEARGVLSCALRKDRRAFLMGLRVVHVPALPRA